MINFTVDGQPKRKERPRFSRACNYIRTYTPKQTKEYEQHIRDCYLEQVGTNSMIKDKPMMIEIVAYYSIPKSWSKKKSNLAIYHMLYPTNKIDLDNTAKVILDALNGIAYGDDHYVVDLRVKKLYSLNPRVEVSIYELVQNGEY